MIEAALTCSTLNMDAVIRPRSGAMFEWIEGFYNPHRRHTSLGDLSPADYGALHTAAEIAA
jgi:hypothetical protein